MTDWLLEVTGLKQYTCCPGIVFRDGRTVVLSNDRCAGHGSRREMPPNLHC